eukprot:10908135-Ditylum_brightwellii.AAC.1
MVQLVMGKMELAKYSGTNSDKLTKIATVDKTHPAGENVIPKKKGTGQYPHAENRAYPLTQLEIWAQLLTPPAL